ncbi:MAG TPA: magnesium chelatase [Clostridiales bacterium]|nr:magnesium chelatase [Clostridiales bacterium]
MLSKVLSYGLNGINGYPVLVETDVYNGLPSYEICGLPDASVKESKERVRSALKNSGYEYPAKKITINLAPADQRKEGPIYDLAIAIGLLTASEQINGELLKYMVLFGELSLNGDIRPVAGLLPMVIDAKKRGYNFMVVPHANLPEIKNIEGIKILPLWHLTELVAVLNKEQPPRLISPQPWEYEGIPNDVSIDFSDIRGQEKAKRAMEIAAAGGHNILLIGSPGSGKSMLAKALPGILPDFTFGEALDVTQIHSAAGETKQGRALISVRPFRSPHHTASSAAIIGGGQKCLPGEISLAHRGVLYFDELPEFERNVLEALRQPLEDGVVSVSRANNKVSYPADFMFVCSMNPCPCGNYGSDAECRCSPTQIGRYLSKISGPLLDRLDIHVEMGRIQYGELHGQGAQETSSTVRQRVNRARDVQRKRYGKLGKYCNAQLMSAQLKEYCPIHPAAEELLKNAYEKMKMSARSYTRVLLVARTIADLDGSAQVLAPHIAESIQYRTLDRKYWANRYD